MAYVAKHREARPRRITLMLVVMMVVSLVAVTAPVQAKPADPNSVHARLKTAQPFEWSAPDAFFTGHEGASIKYSYSYSDTSFHGVLEMDGFKQAGPYALTIDTKDDTTLADYGCDVWDWWTDVHGETFAGGTNGCWSGNPYADVKLFTLTQYDSNRDKVIGDGDSYRAEIPFDVPLPDGTYNLKFFVKLDWNLTSPDSNIMMMNDMTGYPRYGKVVARKHKFNYDQGLIIADGFIGRENLILQTSAWCTPDCDAPSSDPGYEGTTGYVLYDTVSDTFRGIVVLSNDVTPPTPQLLQIKLEGMGSLSPNAESNEWLGYIGRWWDNTTNWNITDAVYEVVKGSNDVLGYVIFDAFDPSSTFQTFALDSSFHTLAAPQSGRPAPGSVVMTDGDYVASFALTEDLLAWRGVFMSERPLEFTIAK